MRISYIGKKTSVRDSFKEQCEKKLKRLEKFFRDVEEDVVVSVTNNGERETVEITVRAHGMFFRAERTTEDRLSALDSAVDVLVAQIVKNKSRLESRHKNINVRESIGSEFGVSEWAEESDVLVRTKRFALQTMSVDDAILRMNMLGHTFYIFSDSQSGATSVVYLRRDGNYGQIVVQD